MKKGLIKIICAGLMATCFSGAALGAIEDEKTQPSVRNEETASGAETNGSGTAQKEDKSPLGGEWVREGDDWQYRLSDGEYLESEWLPDDKKWYYLDEDGYMALGLKRINGKYYFFRENGEMAVGWAYDEEEEKWYYLNEDGTRKTGWLQAGDIWYWFDSKGVMYSGGARMVDGHKYYFFENGQMAANRYVGIFYYGASGLRDREHDMTIQGRRKPTDEEKEAITKAMENIPGELMAQCLKSGWQFMFYTDKEFFSAPSTDQGIYYVNYQTDKNYKKIKFTKPEALTLAFGEYVALVTGNNKAENHFMADFQQYLAGSSLVQPLPSYFDDKAGMWFGLLFESYCNPGIAYDIKKQNPDLAAFVEKSLGVSFKERRPTPDELFDRMSGDGETMLSGIGPSADETLGTKKGPASAGDAV